MISFCIISVPVLQIYTTSLFTTSKLIDFFRDGFLIVITLPQQHHHPGMNGELGLNVLESVKVEIFGQYQRQGAGLAIAVQQLIVARTQMPLRILTAVSTKEMVAAVSIPSSLLAFSCSMSPVIRNLDADFGDSEWKKVEDKKFENEYHEYRVEDKEFDDSDISIRTCILYCGNQNRNTNYIELSKKHHNKRKCACFIIPGQHDHFSMYIDFGVLSR